MKVLLFAIILLFRLPVNAQEAPKTPGKKKAVYLVAHLREVVAANQYIQTRGVDKRHLETYIDGYPTLINNNYLVRVCEFNGMLCHVHFFFYVNAKTYVIKYFDVAANKSLPLKIWRKQMHPNSY